VEAYKVGIMNRTGIIWVAEEKKEAVKKMLNDLPYYGSQAADGSATQPMG